MGEVSKVFCLISLVSLYLHVDTGQPEMSISCSSKEVFLSQLLRACVSYLGARWGCEDEFPPTAVMLLVMVQVAVTASI